MLHPLPTLHAAQDNPPVLARRVRRLRVALGLSQSELASRARQPATSVSLIETASTVATADVITAFARALGCTPEYLTDDIPEPAEPRPQLRAYADAPKRHVDTLVEDAITAVEASATLELTRIPSSIPLFGGDANDDDSIELLAYEIRAQLGLHHDEPITNAVRAAERLGCMVLPLDSELGRHLGVSFWVDETPVIRVSRASLDPAESVPGDRQRFTVAHELGHLALHRFAPPPATPADAARVEREAHRFAGAFLAPAEAVRERIAARRDRVTLSVLASMKEQWGVSIKALVVRVRQLGLIDDDHARSLYKQISARKWNKLEPVHVDNETAVWWGRALTDRYSTASVERAAQESGLAPSYFMGWASWEPLPAAAEPIDFVAAARRKTS